jgi:MerR family mercuric resistance operon transcriptional regulator
MASGPFTLAQLARAVGMSVDDVQFYRDHGLLQPARRRRGRSGESAYHDEHVDRLRFIKRALGYGFPLDAIGRFVDATALLTCSDVMTITTARLEQLRRERGSGDPTVLALGNLVALCSGKGGRADCQLLAALARGDS